jgi:6-phosphogluconolactonase (cycloisomerase 2 family)
MEMKPVSLVSAVFLLTFFVGCSNSNPPQGAGFMYVASQGNTSLATYQVNDTTGALTQIGSILLTGSVPTAMAVGVNTLFVLNNGSSDLSIYTINSNGTLTGAGTQCVQGTATPCAATDSVAIATDPGGTFLFVANRASNSISVYTISGTTLTEVTGSPFVTDPTPAGIQVDASGLYVYVTNQINGTVSGYNIGAGGFLTAVHGSPFTVGTAPAGMTISPSGSYLYVANSGSNNLSAFTICTTINATCVAADGSLVPVFGSPFSAGLGPIAMTVITITASAGGEQPYLFSVNQQANQVSSYRLSEASGALTATSPGTASTGIHPAGISATTAEIATTSSHFTSGAFIYTPNIGGDAVTGYKVNVSTGVLSAMNPVITGTQPAAIVSGNR